ncbi:MAG TPA: hypothetical protein VHE55_16390 [Fimbriimonadaceae bacterium]|nr:hypothetical protein [Fimbriimonadaceae bacterium]
MVSALALSLLLARPQTIDGIKPVFDPTPKYSQAYVKQLKELGGLDGSSPDLFAIGFFSMKVKMMMPLVQTKYTAAEMGVCGTMLGIYDPEVTKAVKAAVDRITGGTKDFDSFTKEETDKVSSLMAKDSSPLYPFKQGRTEEQQRQYFAGGSLGSLCAYTTVWHISPKQPQLLKLIGDSIKGCADAAGKPEAKSRPDVAAALNEFAKFQGKTYDEATMREIGKQIEATLKASLDPKFRWE